MVERRPAHRHSSIVVATLPSGSGMKRWEGEAVMLLTLTCQL